MINYDANLRLTIIVELPNDRTNELGYALWVGLLTRIELEAVLLISLILTSNNVWHRSKEYHSWT